MNCVFVDGLVVSTIRVFFFVPRLENFTCGLSGTLLGQVMMCSFPILVLKLINVLGRAISGVVCPFLFRSHRRKLIRLNVCTTADGVTVMVTVFARTFHCTCRPFIFKGSERKSGHGVCTTTVGCFLVFSLLTFLTIVFCLSLLHCLITEKC